MNQIAIFGASGFVGGTLAEELIADGVPVRCLIRSSGNAWRLARHGIELEMVDLLDPASIRHALRDCSHVVNCARGKGETMTVGMKNLVDACLDSSIDRFVHISSVAVYGETPSTTAISEDFPTNPEKDSYGWKKLKQDEMVKLAVKRGLNAVTICPPNISGPYSMFLEEICRELKAGTFALVEDGQFPCPLIDVGNLTYAIRLGLETEENNGLRMFVCDDPTASWNEVVSSLNQILGLSTDIPRIDSETAKRMTKSKAISRGSIKKTVSHLVSSNVRSSLRNDPYIGSLEKFAVSFAKRLPESIQSRLRDDQKHIVPIRDTGNYSVRLLSQQLRNVTYSCDAAKQKLNYQPPIGFNASMERFENWAKLHWGLGTAAYRLLSDLS